MKNSYWMASAGTVLLTFFFSLPVALGQATGANELDALFTDPGVKAKPALESWPADLAQDFSVVEPSIESERSPASSKKKNGKKQAKLARRSRLPASVTDGFELRIKYRDLVTTFWVVKRGIRHDLMYSNSEGSKSSLGLSLEQFKTLHTAAQTLQPTKSNLTKCPKASMQMYVVRSGAPERTIEGCVTDQTKTAEGLRNVSNLLAAMVR